MREVAPATPPAMKYKLSCGLIHDSTCFLFSWLCSAVLIEDDGDSSCRWGWTAAAVATGCGDVMAQFEPKSRSAFNSSLGQSGDGMQA